MYNESQGKIKIPLLAIGNDVTLLGIFASEMSHFIESLMQIWPNEVSFLNNTLAKNSIMFSELDEKDFRSMDFLHLVVNDLKFILSFAEFQNSYHLKNAYDVIAHSFCLYGRNYVSALQSKEFPITGVTFRPEAIAFEQIGKVETSVGPKAIRIARLMGDSLVDFAKKNNRTMSIEEKKKYDYIDPYETFPILLDGKYQHIYKRKK